MGASTLSDSFPYVPGFLYCLAVALVSLATGALYRPVSPYAAAIVYSLLIANIFKVTKTLIPGINFCANPLMEGTIATFGLVVGTVTLHQVSLGILYAIFISFLALLLCLWFGRKIGLSDRFTTLIGIGLSISGSSAIASAATVINSKEEEIRIAINCTNLFSLISMFVYPLLFVFTFPNHWLKGGLNGYTLWIGSSIHEISHLTVAAGMLGFNNIGPALIMKLFRIFMISPALLLVCHFLKLNEKETSKERASRFVLPIYGIIFIFNTFLCTFLETNFIQIDLLRSLWIVFQDVLRKVILPLFLTTALAGVGLKLNIRNILRIETRPFILAAIITIIVGFLSLILTITTSSLIQNMI